MEKENRGREGEWQEALQGRQRGKESETERKGNERDTGKGQASGQGGSGKLLGITGYRSVFTV